MSSTVAEYGIPRNLNINITTHKLWSDFGFKHSVPYEAIW